MNATGIHSTPVSHPLTPQQQRLQRAGAEFEAQLLSSLWKSMKNSLSADEDSTDLVSQSFQDWGIEAISGAVSRAGGIGIGKLILKGLTEKLDRSQNGNRTSQP